MDISGLNVQGIYIFYWHGCIQIFNFGAQITFAQNR